MATPSIAMIPSGVKAGKVYSVLPTNGVGDFDFTRASTSTRINKDGLIETVATGVPRLNYYDGDCPSLLLEPQSTNLIPYSEDFSDASWANFKQGSGVFPIKTVNYGISPSGELNATRLQCNITNLSSPNRSAIVNNFSVVNGGVYYITIYVKSNTNENQSFSVQGSALTDNSGFNRQFIATPQWERLIYAGTSILTGSSSLRIGLLDSTLETSNDVLIWGAQVEQNSNATSYIPTTGTTQTRVTETCGGAGDANSINSEEGVLYAEISSLFPNIGISLSNGDNSNRVTIYNTLTSIRVIVTLGGVAQVDFTVNGINSNQFSKIAFLYSENNFKLYRNGLLIGSDTSGSTFTPNVLNVLHFALGDGVNFPFYGNFKDLRVYTTALTDSELQELTTY